MAALAIPLTQGLRVDARFGRFAGVTAAVSAAVLQVQTAFEGVALLSTLLLAAVLIGAAWGISRELDATYEQSWRRSHDAPQES